MEPIAGSSAADLNPVKRKIPQKSTGKKYWFLFKKASIFHKNDVLKFEYLLGDSEITPVEKVSEAPKTVKKSVKKTKKKATAAKPEISTTGKSF